ncbi:hypothetical protein ACFL3T_00785 [Patescibacteria group bacterium]
MSNDESLLEIDKIEFSEKHPLNEGQKGIIQEVITWGTQPPLVKTGRSSFLLIEEDKLPFKGMKIKGCGFFDAFNHTAMQPSKDEGYEAHMQHAPDGVKEIHYQVEVDDKDELIYTIPKQRPYGAQNYDQAKHEFKVYETLENAWEGDPDKYPFYYPIAHAKYKDMENEGKPLGVGVFGMRTKSELMLGPYFAGQFEDKGLRINPQLLEYWQKNLSKIGQKEPDYFDILKTLQVLSREFGKSLSSLHEHFVDHDSHLFNCSVDNDNGVVMIYDLDHVIAAKDISDQKYYYYCMKDFEIALVAIMSNFLLNGLMYGIPLFKDLDKQIDEFNILRGFFEGYFGELSKEAVYYVKSMWKRLVLVAVNNLIEADTKDHLGIVYSFCENERGQSYLDIFPFLKEKINKTRPDFDMKFEEHEKIVSKFLQQKIKLSKEHNVTS